MITVSILALRHAAMASIADSRYVFKMVNTFLADAGKEPVFDIRLVGTSNEVKLDDEMFSIHPDILLKDVKSTDLVIIPSLTGEIKRAVYVNREYAHWIGQQYKNGVEIASLCTGAFLMAYSGLLTGKQCTTHWSYANEFKYYYPAVQLVDERVITDQNGLYSSGGNNAYWNLLLHLVEKYTSREMAIRTAKYFVVDIDRSNQSPFIIFNGLKDHEDDLIKRAQERIEKNYRERLTVYQLADEFSLSRRTFERRFKKATRSTVTEYVQRVKVEGAKKQFEIGRKSISETMHDVGYTDLPAFRNVFKRITGMTPVDYRNKYRVAHSL